MQGNEASHTASWRAQLKKGTLELAVLALLSKERRYGLELIDLLDAHHLDVSEGSIYPLLSRLRNEGKIEAEWVEESSGHAHKYYRLTPRGEQMLKAMLGDWRVFSESFSKLTKDIT
jgi:PadR family transcriptional regulator, regulatory protein PadR